MDYYDVWNKNRVKNCNCDWCRGWFKPVKNSWTDVVWDPGGCVDHTPNALLTPADAMCSVTMTSTVVDFFKLWESNKDVSCKCDWCYGRFHATTDHGFNNWFKVAWSHTAKDHEPGAIVTRAEACCQRSIVSAAPREIKTGFNCKICNFKNDYAAANQSDGSYICFNCR